MLHMINKVIDGISKAINEEFGDEYNIYTEEIEQGLKEPCFSIASIKPTNNLFRQNKYYREHPICIHYFPSSKEKKHECQEVTERLYLALEYIEIEEIFDKKVIKSKVRGTKMNTEYNDGVLHFFVNYDFYVNKIEDAETPMDSCDYNTDVRKG